MVGGEQDTDGRRLSGPTSHLQGTLLPQRENGRDFLSKFVLCME